MPSPWVENVLKIKDKEILNYFRKEGVEAKINLQRDAGKAKAY